MKHIESSTIEEIYKNFVQINYTEEYKNRYVPLPLHKNIKNWKWEGKDFPRVIALLEFEKYVEKYDFKIDKFLMLNGANPDDPELEFLENRIKKIDYICYDKDTNNNDLHNLNLPDNDYDFAMANQTFEHLYNPQQCFNNIKNHLKEGGYLYINVPTCNVPHSEPYHYFTGYMPMGLALAAYQVGFKILEIGQWGNFEYIYKNWSRTPLWPDYTQLSTPGLNETGNPVITWGLFKK